MVEAVALLGGLLLLLDRRIPGGPRERSVVAYFRARGGAQACHRPVSHGSVYWRALTCSINHVQQLQRHMMVEHTADVPWMCSSVAECVPSADEAHDACRQWVHPSTR
jgi:hypothetical protein